MPSIATVSAALEAIAPLALAADWDAVGLLVDPRGPDVSRVMTCLSLTPETAAEAARERADLVVSHHPLPFRPVSRITNDTATGRVLLTLIGAGIGIWSSHTAWDSAAGGINDQLAALLGVTHVTPLQHAPLHPLAGFGRVGSAAEGWSVARLARHAADCLGSGGVQVAGDAARPAGRVGIVCGSGGEAVATAAAAGCHTFLTGEIRLHHALEAGGLGMAVIAVGHHASERFAMNALATRLAEAIPGLCCWASRDETDPLPWLA